MFLWWPRGCHLAFIFFLLVNKQWGTSVNGMLNVLPIAFNNNGYTLVATANGYVANPESVRVVKVLSKNQIQIISSEDSSTAMGSYWIAMGE